MEKEGERVKNKGKTSNRCMTAVLRALVFSVLSVAVMVSVCPGLRSYWDLQVRRAKGGGDSTQSPDSRRVDSREEGGTLSNAGGCVCLGG